MHWIHLTDEEQLKQIISNSQNRPQVIFKHSTRCSISSMALSRFERQWDIDSNLVTPFYLDLLAFRKISNAVAEKFNIMHESPQVLLIRNGECTYDTSHNAINVKDFNELLTIV